MQTVPIDIPDFLAARFATVCLGSERVQREVISELLMRYLEDIEDVVDAERVLSENGERMNMEQMRASLGLEN